jgi:hypothetical protein
MLETFNFSINPNTCRQSSRAIGEVTMFNSHDGQSIHHCFEGKYRSKLHSLFGKEPRRDVDRRSV